jgi:hypothetical protein
MAWTDIPDKSTGDLMDETWYDTHFKANMEYLLNPHNSQILRDNSGAYTTNSTSFVDIDGTNLSITLTTYGGPVLVYFAGNIYRSAGSDAMVCLDVDVDDTRIASSFAYGLIAARTNGAVARVAVSCTALITSLLGAIEI